MTRVRIAHVILLLSFILLLTSCSIVEIHVDKNEKKADDPLAIQITWYVTEDSLLTNNVVTSADLDALHSQTKECVRILQSEEILDKVRNEVGGISNWELRSMTEISSVKDTGIISLTISSDQYTEEQLQKIADAYIDVASTAIDEVYLGTVQLTLVAKETVE